MANLYSQKTYDAALLLRATAAAIIATETGSLIVDVGNGFVEGDLVIDIATLDTVTGDEYYDFVIQGSSDATFGTAANITVLAAQCVGGVTGVNVGIVGSALGTVDVIGRFLIPFRNERNGTLYRYIRLKTVIGGTTPSITFQAFIARD